jgi:hypothetical protein
VLLEEAVRLLETWRRETNPTAVAVDEGRSAPETDPISGVAAGDRTDHARNHDADDRQRAAAGKGGRRHQRGLTGNR